VHLIEVEERRLDLRAACTSMFDFCQRRLGMSEGAAFRRINAARLVKRFPGLLQRIERGELHLSTLVLIRPHLTEQNIEELVAAVVGKTQRQVEALLARIAPKRDVPSAIVELGALSNDAAPSLFAGAETTPAVSGPATSSTSSAPWARIEPLSEARYKVQLTASAELKAKLERACDLTRHRNPSGDLAPVLDAAMDLLLAKLAKLEKERLGKVRAPRAPKQPNESKEPEERTATSGARASRARAISAAVRREVFERDGEPCTFVDDTGARCPSRGHLELDHVEARALGGTNAASNLRVRCHAHNRRAAEEVFGKAYVAERIDFLQRKSRPAGSAVPSPPPPPPPPEAIELALGGLQNMGFAKADARRAVEHVSQRRIANGDGLEVQELLRGAIAALT
jgi:5-methylcytosine-specific restriction endonuclease McrA